MVVQSVPELEEKFGLQYLVELSVNNMNVKRLLISLTLRGFILTTFYSLYQGA